MAGEDRGRAQQRGPPGPDRQPAAAVRAPGHRRHAPDARRHPGGAGRLGRRQGDRRDPRRHVPLHREPLRRREHLHVWRRQPGVVRHRRLARGHGIRLLQHLQPGAPHPRRRRRGGDRLGPGCDRADPRGCQVVHRPGRHEPRRLHGGLSGRAGRGLRQPENPDRGGPEQLLRRLVRQGLRPRRRILGEEAGQAAAGAAAQRRHRRPDGQRRGPGRGGHGAGRQDRAARRRRHLPLPDHRRAHPGAGRLAGALHPDRAGDRRGDPDRPQDRAARPGALGQGFAAHVQLFLLGAGRDRGAAAEGSVHGDGDQRPEVPGAVDHGQPQELAVSAVRARSEERRRSAAAHRAGGLVAGHHRGHRARGREHEGGDRHLRRRARRALERDQRQGNFSAPARGRRRLVRLHRQLAARDPAHRHHPQRSVPARLRHRAADPDHGRGRQDRPQVDQQAAGDGGHRPEHRRGDDSNKKFRTISLSVPTTS